MSFLNNLKLKTKLLLGFGVIIVLLCIVSGIAIYSLNAGSKTAEHVENVFQNRYAFVSKTARLINEANNNLAIYLSPGAQSEANKNKFISSINELSTELQQAKQAGIGGRIDEIISGVNHYRSTYDEIIDALVRNNMPFDALSYYMTNMLPEAQKLSDMQYGILDEMMTDISSSVSTLSNNSYILLVTVVTILSIVVAYIIAQLNTHYVLNRLKINHSLASSIAHSDLTVHVDTSGRDEFGDLSRTMNSMKQDLNRSMVGIVNFASQLQDKLNQVKNMANNVVQDAQNVEAQAVNVAASSNEMASTTTTIAQTCESAAQVSRQSLDITQNGVDSIRGTINEIRHQSQRTQDDAAKIKALTSQIDKISDIVNTINDIAAQTNLLALNAAIEAARAGEAGRGFAVVADEVRALSQRTSASTQVISETVTNIQNEARQAEESMQMSVDNMDGVANRTASIEGLLNDITNHVGQVNEYITQIVSAIEQQSISTGEVSNNMQNISISIQDVSSESAKSNSIIDDSMQSLNELMDNLAQFKLSK